MNAGIDDDDEELDGLRRTKQKSLTSNTILMSATSVTSSNTASKASVMSATSGGNVDNAKVVAGAGSVIEVNKVIL